MLVFFSLLCAPSPTCSKFASQQPQPLCNTNIKPYLGHVRNSVPIAPTDGELPPSYPGQDLLWSVVGTVCKGSAAGERGESPGFSDPGRRRGTLGPGAQPLTALPCQHGVEQDPQAPDVTALVVALAFQDLSTANKGRKVCLILVVKLISGEGLDLGAVHMQSFQSWTEQQNVGLRDQDSKQIHYYK